MDDDEIRSEFQKCPRKVPKNMYGQDAESKKYWNNVFKTLENELKIPPIKRHSILKEVFSEDLLHALLKIFTDIRYDSDVDSTTDVFNADTEDNEILNKYQRRSSYNQRKKSIFVAEIKSDFVDYRVLLTQTDRSCTTRDNLMYKRFLNMPVSLAARWNPKPPLTFTGMNLGEKCDAITRDIAENFIQWLKELGGDEETTLDVPTILNLFAIGFNAHAADSLCVKVEELLSVTKAVANSRNMPESSNNAHLYKQLFRDINSVRKAEDLFAFGTMLPPEMREIPQKVNVAATWLQNDRIPDKIASMAVVWGGIEHLKSTQGYCGWLLDHPEVEPPPYLQEMGILQNELNKRSIHENPSI